MEEGEDADGKEEESEEDGEDGHEDEEESEGDQSLLEEGEVDDELGAKYRTCNQ